MQGKIFDIQRFCTSDGPGIRTTVFFKGCPLTCKWCHNPESQSKDDEFLFYRDKCISCGTCMRGRPCPNGARRECGQLVFAEDIIKKICEDKIFYKNSGGGLTLSGGEPLLQIDFAEEILRLAKKENISTAVETCGFATSENILRISKHTDLFLFDYKISDRNKHKEMTGVYNDTILENLHLVDHLGKKIVLRCPIVPGVNDDNEHLRSIASLANKLDSVLSIELEPYHDLGISKYKALNRSPNIYPVPEKDHVEKLCESIKKLTHKPIIIL